SYDFLKVPYHGRYLKRFDDLIDGRNIKYAVITSSDEEVEDIQTIESLDNNSVHYYLTRKGQIDILSDGKNIKVNQ
ncbi:MAG: MBL fold metallo-hydrolase, partial [Bacilli bacterium]|nr:MBL fold metallo-hydrolase [Bacilli bacterium]